MTTWSLAVSPPCCEGKVSEALSRFDFQNYLFRTRRRVVRNGRVLSDLVPVFPSYVFVAANNSWEFIREATCVVGFVKFGGIVAEVPEDDVLALARKCDRVVKNDREMWVLPEDDAPLARFKQGQAIQVVRGAIQGLGTYERSASLGRAVVLVDLMGRKVPISVAEADLVEVVEAKSKRRRPPKHLRSSVTAGQPTL